VDGDGRADNSERWSALRSSGAGSKRGSGELYGCDDAEALPDPATPRATDNGIPPSTDDESSAEGRRGSAAELRQSYSSSFFKDAMQKTQPPSGARAKARLAHTRRGFTPCRNAGVRRFLCVHSFHPHGAPRGASSRLFENKHGIVARAPGTVHARATARRAAADTGSPKLLSLKEERARLRELERLAACTAAPAADSLKPPGAAQSEADARASGKAEAEAEALRFSLTLTHARDGFQLSVRDMSMSGSLRTKCSRTSTSRIGSRAASTGRISHRHAFGAGGRAKVEGMTGASGREGWRGWITGACACSACGYSPMVRIAEKGTNNASIGNESRGVGWTFGVCAAPVAAAAAFNFEHVAAEVDAVAVLPRSTSSHLP
jgi:hypothetical protein